VNLLPEKFANVLVSRVYLVDKCGCTTILGSSVLARAENILILTIKIAI
jgi:hypothetical protein